MLTRFPKDDIASQIGFDFIKQYLQQTAISQAAKERFNKMVPFSQIGQANAMLAEVNARIYYEQERTNSINISQWFLIPDNLEKTSIQNYFLSIDDVLELRGFLSLAIHIFSKLNKIENPQQIVLKDKYSNTTKNLEDIVSESNKLIDNKGEINKNASNVLSKLFLERERVEKSLQAALNEASKAAKKKDPNLDLSPAVRNGRFVIPVSTSMRNLIEGIVQGESAGGKISFVEPLAVIQANNQLSTIQFDINREIERLLIALSARIAPFIKEIRYSEQKIIHLDFLQAIIKYAAHFKAILPKFSDKLSIRMNDARHPQLEYTLTQKRKYIVPLNFIFNQNNRLMIISGPNAGGKSVALKTFMVLQYSAQCGLPILANDNAETIWFSHFLSDIGDNQSMDSDLSTYSAHLAAMRHFLTIPKGNTFIGIDEIGSGTDPLLGSPLAEAMLENFDEKEYFGIVTTHFSNLKRMASKENGIFNASMLIDTEKMEPLFELVIGKPGSSFVFELAHRKGIPNKIISKAKEKTSEDYARIDYLLADLDTKQSQLFKEKQLLEEKNKMLAKMVADYDELKQNIVKSKNQILQQAKIEAANILANANKQIEKTVKIIKEKKANPLVVKTLKKEIEKAKTEFDRDSNNSALFISPKKIEKIYWKIGDFASIDNETSAVEIINIKNKKAEVVNNNVRTMIAVDRLFKVEKNNHLVKNLSPHLAFLSNKISQFSPIIDLRGMREQEARERLRLYFDDVYAIGAIEVKIIHGRGDGALKKMTKTLLKELSNIKSWVAEHAEMGGDGATIVYLH